MKIIDILRMQKIKRKEWILGIKFGRTNNNST